MRNNLKLILSTYIKQQDANDCAQACLLSIFKYAGLAYEPTALARKQRSTLLDLHRSALNAGLISRCVRMDIETLRGEHSPCILHVLNDNGLPHFVVHYPYQIEPGLHLIGDPARKLTLITEDELLTKWESKAALIFDYVKPLNKWSYKLFPWTYFSAFRIVPKVLCLSVALLNIFAAVLGLGTSVIIQRAVDPGFLNSRQTFFIILFLLLVVISVAKCLINYLRQWMMIHLGSQIDSKLYPLFLRNPCAAFNPNEHFSHYYHRIITGVQKVHQAIALLVGVVFSDGLLVMVMLGCLYYYEPALVLFEISVSIAMFLTIDNYLPLLIVYSDDIQLPSMNTDFQQTINLAQTSKQSGNKTYEEDYFRLNEGVARAAKSLSMIANKINIAFEIITTFNIILVLCFCMYKFQIQLISYEHLLITIIICYGINLLVVKICNQLFTIAKGAAILKQNSAFSENETTPHSPS